MDKLLLILAVSLLSYVFVAGILRWMLQRQLLDIPNERSSHTRPTPRGGGLAIGVLTLVGCLAFALTNATDSVTEIVVYIAGSLIIMTVGIVDDMRTLSSRQRFLVQGLVAVIFVLVVGYWPAVELPLLGVIPLGPLGLIVTVFWIVGLVNAFNFMDGTDGMAGGVALVVSMGWAFLPWPDTPSSLLVRLLGLLIAASCIGFLGHNWSPAKIFMGDVGSTFLGFTFATLPLLLNPHDPRLPLAAALLVWPFLFDTVLTIIRRLNNRENIFAAHRSHLYQRLVIMGYSHSFVGLLYIIFSAMGVVLAWLWITHTTIAPIAIVVLLPLAAFIYLGLVSYRENQNKKGQVSPTQ